MRTAGGLWRSARATPRRRVVGEAVATFLFGLALIAIGLVGTSGPREHEPSSPWLFVLPLTAICVLMLAKRTRPGLTASLGTLVLLLDQVMGGSIGVIVGYFDLIYCVALWGRRTVLRRTEVLVAIAVTASAAVPFVLTGNVQSAALLAIVVFTLLATPLWWGRSVRTQSELARVAAARAQDRHRLAELREVEVLRDERTRMAHELHDALAGNLAAIGIHAEAALSRGEDAGDSTARTSLTAIRQASVAASNELRAMVHLLRSGDDDRIAPARLAEVEGLVEQATHRGLSIEVDRPEPWPELPATVDHAAHRIVQESLTNAATHAPAARVRIDIEPTPSSLDLCITNTLAAVGPVAGRGDGVGLLSMRERVTALGGSFRAGPVDGRWQVRASLPLAGRDEGGRA
ncbi:histidine kinase [Janibacter sp. GS2]|uniref:sensor histidine kinase n=1 Tax=Janibacter sp. GS2 TaxID=3442646 RepID=UPI003EBE5CA3